MSTTSQTLDDGIQLVGESTMLAAVWPEKTARPSHRTIINWRNQGKIPFVQLDEGGRVYYSVPDVKKAVGKLQRVPRALVYKNL